MKRTCTTDLVSHNAQAAREALKETEHYWRLTGMLGFPGRPFEMAIEQILDQCDAAQVSMPVTMPQLHMCHHRVAQASHPLRAAHSN